MAEAADDRNAPALRQLRTSLGTVSYREAGTAEAPALLLLHGVGSGSASWAAQLAGLSSRFRVIAWDAPGYGGSDALASAAPAAADYAAALAAFVAALRLERFCLLGHSLGALVAASFCRGRDASRVERLVLASPAVGYGRASEEVRRARIDGRLADMAALGPAGLAERRAAALLTPGASPETLARVRAVMRGLRPDGYAQAVHMLAQADLFEDAPAIARPTLVVCGTADQVTPDEQSRRVAAAVPGARYVALPGLAHACYVEDPAGFNRVIQDFLRPERTA